MILGGKKKLLWFYWVSFWCGDGLKVNIFDS